MDVNWADCTFPRNEFNTPGRMITRVMTSLACCVFTSHLPSDLILLLSFSSIPCVFSFSRPFIRTFPIVFISLNIHFSENFFANFYQSFSMPCFCSLASFIFRNHLTFFFKNFYRHFILFLSYILLLIFLLLTWIFLLNLSIAFLFLNLDITCSALLRDPRFIKRCFSE